MIEGCSLKLLRALRFFLKSFYFFLNRIARYAQSKESRNLLKKIPQITCKVIFRNCLNKLFEELFSSKSFLEKAYTESFFTKRRSIFKENAYICKM